MRGMVHRPGRECAQWMTFITALPLYIHTHPITAWINWSSYLSFPSTGAGAGVFFSLLYQLHNPLLPFLLLYSSCPRFTARALHKKSEGTFWEGRGVLLEKTVRRPPLRGRPFAGSHTLGIIRIYVCSSIPPHLLLCCRPISGQKGSPEHDSSLSAFDQNELCPLDSLWHFISPLCPPPLSVQHREWNVQDRVHILLYACCHARTVRDKR